MNETDSAPHRAIGKRLLAPRRNQASDSSERAVEGVGRPILLTRHLVVARQAMHLEDMELRLTVAELRRRRERYEARERELMHVEEQHQRACDAAAADTAARDGREATERVRIDALHAEVRRRRRIEVAWRVWMSPLKKM